MTYTECKFMNGENGSITLVRKNRSSNTEHRRRVASPHYKLPMLFSLN
jgi:hypothetical protein